jgi:hypothetical protein
MQAIGTTKQTGGRIWRSFDSLDEQLRDWIKRLEGLADIGGPSIEELGNKVSAKVAPVVRRFLLENYANSDMGKRASGSKYRKTDKLKSAIGSAVVAVTPGFRFGKRWTGLQLKINMPANVAPYESQAKSGERKPSNFYTVAASLNYGSVRAPKVGREVIDLPTGQRSWKEASIVGSSAKRSIKKMILGGGMSYRSRKRIQEGTQSRQWGGQIIGGHVLENAVINPRGGSLNISGYHTVVTAPKNFFRLTPQQKKIIERVVHSVVIESAGEMMKKWGS